MSGPSRRFPKKAQEGYNSYLRFTGLGFTMIGIILAFCFVGYWLDGVIGLKYPVLTVVLSLVGIAGSMVYLFKETSSKK